MPREKKNSSKVKSPSNQNGQPKKKRRGSAAAQQQSQQNNPNMQQMQNNYQIVASNHPFEDFANAPQMPPNNGNQAQQMQMNGPRGIPPNGGMPNMQLPNQQMHGNYPMSNGQMMQPNYPQMNGMPNNGQMNGPPMTNQYQMMQNNMNLPPNANAPQMKAMNYGKQAMVYPPGRSVISNPANANAPPIFSCKMCRQEVHENEQGIMCESGCQFWYHRRCTNLSELAFKFLKDEVFAEWCCETCEQTKTIPLVKEFKQ